MQKNRALSKLLLIPGLAAVLILLVLPLVGIVRFSFEGRSASSFSDGTFTFENYARVFTDARFLGIIARTFLIALGTTLLSLLYALPISYYLGRASERVKSVLTIVILFPLLTGNVVLSVGWVAILSPSGILSQMFQSLGVLDGPLEIMRTVGTLAFLMSLVNLPMIVLSMQGNVDQVGVSTERAAYSLGASRFRAYRQILLPQYLPGIVAGTSLSFVLTVNAYATPTLIAGSKVAVAAPEIYALVSIDGNWPLGGAFSLIVVALSFLITSLFTWFASRSVEKWQVTR